MAADLRLLIADAFDDYGSMEKLLRRLGLLAKCITSFMDEEGFESARDLALARKVTRIKALCVCFKRCLMINQIPDID